MSELVHANRSGLALPYFIVSYAVNFLLLKFLIYPLLSSSHGDIAAICGVLFLFSPLALPLEIGVLLLFLLFGMAGAAGHRLF